MPNLKFLAWTVPDIWISQNSKIRSRDSFMTPFDLILHFFDVPCRPSHQSVCEIWCQYLHLRPIYGYFTTSLIWLRNAYSRPFCRGLMGVWPPVCSRILWKPPKGTSLAGNAFWRIDRADRSRNATWARAEESEKKRTERCNKSHHPRCATSTKVVMWGAVPDVVNHAKFSSKSVKGFWLPEGSQSAIFLCLALWLIQCLKKNIPDIFSCNSRKHRQIFIIFGIHVTEKSSNQ